MPEWSNQDKRGSALTTCPKDLKKLEDNIQGLWALSYVDLEKDTQVDLICRLDEHGNIEPLTTENGESVNNTCI